VSGGRKGISEIGSLYFSMRPKNHIKGLKDKVFPRSASHGRKEEAKQDPWK
jgi:hypothetical protein